MTVTVGDSHQVVAPGSVSSRRAGARPRAGGRGGARATRRARGTATGARTIASASATTPSQTSTFSASSSVRSSREGTGTAPRRHGVTTVSWIVAIRASALVDRRCRGAPAGAPRGAVCAPRLQYGARLGVERLGLESRAMRAIWARSEARATLERVEVLLEVVDRHLLRRRCGRERRARRSPAAPSRRGRARSATRCPRRRSRRDALTTWPPRRAGEVERVLGRARDGVRRRAPRP